LPPWELPGCACGMSPPAMGNLLGTCLREGRRGTGTMGSPAETTPPKRKDNRGRPGEWRATILLGSTSAHPLSSIACHWCISPVQHDRTPPTSAGAFAPERVGWGHAACDWLAGQGGACQPCRFLSPRGAGAQQAPREALSLARRTLPGMVLCVCEASRKNLDVLNTAELAKQSLIARQLRFDEAGERDNGTAWARSSCVI